MVEVKLHIPIGPETDNRWMAMWGEENAFFSTETLDKIFQSNKDDNDIKFNIHCDGGSVYEGLAIYDKLRTSGKNIHMNVEGGCHSMAVTLLLAAPKENRTANVNCRALIHEVQVPINDYSLSTSDLRELQDQAEREQSAILDIYAERTGTDRTVLEQLMKEEKMRTASELLNYGFISSINSYNTNKKTKKTMSKETKNSVLNKVDGFLKGIKNLLDGGAMNYDFADAEGTVLFSTEKEDDSLEVGDAASPDGTFELTDGRQVVIAEGAITEIIEAVEEPAEDEELENLRAENMKMRAELQNAVGLINDLKNEIGSSYKPKARATNTRQVKTAPNATELKNEMKENRTNWKGGKK